MTADARTAGRIASDSVQSAAISAYVEKLIADWPPLNDEQRTRLAELLKPVRIGGAA